MNILVVEDEDFLLRLMVRILERAGHEVTSAEDAVTGLELFGEGGVYDAAVVDVGIPPGGAQELLPALLARAPGLHVVLTSGDLLPDALREQLANCQGRFLRKPFTPKALARLIHDMRERKEGAC